MKPAMIQNPVRKRATQATPLQAPNFCGRMSMISLQVNDAASVVRTVPN